MVATTQEFRHSPHYSRDSFSSVMSASSGGELPYANSCLEYGLDLIEQALIEQDPDSPRSSTSPTTLRSCERDYDDDEANWLQRDEVTITFTGAEVEGREDLRRGNGGRDSTQSSGWQDDDTDLSQWRRDTVVLDEEDVSGASLGGGRHGQRRITISTDHSSEMDMGPLTPTGLDGSDTGEVWPGREDRAPSWAASDIVRYYNTGWLDDQRKQHPRPGSGGAPARASTSTDSFRGSVQRRQVSEWRDEEEEDVRGREDDEVDDFPPMHRLPASSSGRSVMPGNRRLLNTRSQDGHHHPDPSNIPAARPRPGSGNDSAWRDSGIWSPGLVQSRSVTSLSATAKMQGDDRSASPGAPRLRGMRSLLLTKPITPKRSQSDNPTIPEMGALRELASRGSESAPPMAAGANGRRFDALELPAIPASSPPDMTKQFVPSAQAMDEQNRRYHYQKPKRSLSMDQEDAAREKEKMITSGWEEERERATLKKEKKPPTPAPVAKAPSVTKVKPVKSASVGPPKNNWVSSGLAAHGLTYSPNVDYMPRRPANAGPPPEKKPKSKAEAKVKAAESKGQGDGKSVKSSDSKSIDDSDTKSTKERKKGRMGNFVVKVLSNKGSKPPPMPPPPTPSTPSGEQPVGFERAESVSSKDSKKKKTVMPVSMVMASM